MTRVTVPIAARRTGGRRPRVPERMRRAAILASALLLGFGSSPSPVAAATPVTATLSAPKVPATIARDLPIAVAFDAPVEGVDSTSLVVSAAGSPIAGQVSYDPMTRTAIFRPADLYPIGARLTVRLTSGVRTMGGGVVRPARWTLAVTRDGERPTITAVSPAAGTQRAQPWQPIVLRASEPVRSAAGIHLVEQATGRRVAAIGTIGPDHRTITVRPMADLAVNTVYRVVAPPSIHDRAGNRLEPWSATFATTSEPYAHPGPAFRYDPQLPVSIWHVPAQDLPLAATTGASIVIKKFQRGDDIKAYLAAARMAGLQVLVGLDWIYRDGHPDLAAARAVAKALAGDPALYGFLSVTEPESYPLSRADLEALDRAYKSADPTVAVVVSLGSLRTFATWGPTHFGPGIADVVICEWYPVVARSAANPDGWTADSAGILSDWHALLERLAPGTPVWGSIAVHAYPPGQRRSPSLAEMADEARDQFRYADAAGLSVYPWTTGTYENDLRRDPRRQGWLTDLVVAILSGTL